MSLPEYISIQLPSIHIVLFNIHYLITSFSIPFSPLRYRIGERYCCQQIPPLVLLSKPNQTLWQPIWWEMDGKQYTLIYYTVLYFIIRFSVWTYTYLYPYLFSRLSIDYRRVLRKDIARSLSTTAVRAAIKQIYDAQPSKEAERWKTNDNNDIYPFIYLLSIYSFYFYLFLILCFVYCIRQRSFDNGIHLWTYYRSLFWVYSSRWSSRS